MAQELILNFNGSDGSVNFTEEANGISPYGSQNCEIDTSWSKFGAGSLLVGVTPSELSTLAYQINAISGDITAHGFIRPAILDASGTSEYIVLEGLNESGLQAAIGFGHNIYGSGFMLLVYDVVHSFIQSVTFPDLSIDEEKHAAIVVQGLSVMLFIAGVKVAEVTLSSALPAINFAGIMSQSGDQFNIDALEVTGSALWDDDFIPPTSPPSLSGERSLIPAAGIGISGKSPHYNVYGIPSAGIGIQAFAPYRFNDVPVAGISIEGKVPSIGSGPYPIPVSSVAVAARNPSYTWVPPVSELYKMQVVYLCILEGSADGLDDLAIPISSFQSIQRDGDPSYLSCVIPNSLAYIEDILARTNGDIVVKKGYKFADGTINAEEICRADYESLQIMRGGRNDSATITGHKTISSTASKYRELTNVSYYGLQEDGKRTFRADPDLFLRVGDLATYNDDIVIVGQISYIVNDRQATMQVTEA